MRYLIKITLLIILVSFFSCKNENPISEKKLDFPKIVDTSEIISTLRNSKWQEVVEYNFLYIGKKVDTIFPNYRLKYFSIIKPLPPFPGNDKKETSNVNHDSINKNNPMFRFYLDGFHKKEYKYYEESNLDIKVDTSITIKKEDYYFDPKTPFYKAYPILITTKEKDTIIIGLQEIIPIELEAKDISGNWKPIEEKYKHYCGTGLGYILLPPKNIVLTSVFVYDGNYKTKLRIKLGKSYSNEFYGKINPKQFESKYDDNGTLKK